MVERNTSSAVMRGTNRRAGVEEHITCKRTASETGRSRVRPLGLGRRSASGKRGAVADDARAREVGPRNRSCEACEQGGANRCGVGGAKDGDQGECAPAKHVPGTGPGKRVTGAGAHTEYRKAKEGGKGHLAH